MRKIYLALLLLSALFFSTQKAKAQLQVIQTSCPKMMLYTWFTHSMGHQYTTIVSWGDGTISTYIYTTFIPLNKTGFEHIYNHPGKYTIKAKFNGDSALITHDNRCRFVDISAYIDNNTNCTNDLGDDIIQAPLLVKVDSAGITTDTVSILGRNYYKVDSGISYTFTLFKPLTGAATLCPANGAITVTALGNNNSKAEFGLKCGASAQYDLDVSMIGFFRPVGVSRLTLHVNNQSCNTKNGILTLNLNNKYKYRSASINPSNISGNIITWNLSNLSAISNKTIQILLDPAVGAKINLNDTICNNTTISPYNGDVNITNNNLTQCDPVRAAYDPNEKQVSPYGDIAPGTKLTYTINFENLGNDTAFNIYILDTLSDKLDISTFEMVSSSHYLSHHFVDGPSKQKIVRFFFPDIHLPDKASPAYNKGFVRFSINVKNGLSPLTQIQNRAGIYFDINPVILTNYAENIIAAPESIGKVNINNNLTIYPNPVTDVLTIKVESGNYESVKLINNIGQVIAHQQLTGTVTQIDMKQLPTGLYYLQVSGKAGSVSHKVEKL